MTLSLLENFFTGFCRTTSCSLLLGSAFALLAGPAHPVYQKWSRGGAILGMVGFAVSFLGDLIFILANGTQFLSHVSLSPFLLCHQLDRAFAAMILALLRTPDEAALLRRQRWIAKLVLAHLSATAIAWISFAWMSGSRWVGGGWRSLWLTSISLTLLVLNPILVSLCFGKSAPGYNSAAAANSSTGAEA